MKFDFNGYKFLGYVFLLIAVLTRYLVARMTWEVTILSVHLPECHLDAGKV